MKRSSCDCKHCQAFCLSIPGYLVYEDLEEIRRFRACSQEDLNDKLRGQIRELIAEETEAQKQLNDFLMNLDVK